jgi:hypothetical protein
MSGRGCGLARQPSARNLDPNGPGEQVLGRALAGGRRQLTPVA